MSPCSRSRGLVFGLLATALASQGAAAQTILPWPPLSLAREKLVATTAGRKALFAGGIIPQAPMFPRETDRVDILDSVTERWSQAALSQPRSQLAATSVGGKAFFAGGVTGITASDRVDIFDSGTGQWTTAALSEPRADLAAASVGTKALFAGGTGTTTLDRVDIYDDATGRWTTAALSEPRSGLVATTVGNKVLFAGGLGSTTVDIYDDSTGEWSTASLSQARTNMVATSVGTKAMFAGGGSPMSGIHSAVVDIYDDATGRWSTAMLSRARGSLAATTVGDRAYFGGGEYPAMPFFFPIGDVRLDVYDNATGTWSQARLSQGRWNLAATSLDGVAVFAGGTITGGSPSAVVDMVVPRAVCRFRNGNELNPEGYACVTRPILGSTWRTSITVQPNTMTTIVTLSLGGPHPGLALFAGELLIAPFPPPLALTGLGSHSLPLPFNGNLLPFVLATQGMRIDDVGGTPTLVLLNAQDLVFGV